MEVTPDQIKKMLHDGITPLQVAQQLGVELNETTTPSLVNGKFIPAKIQNKEDFELNEHSARSILTNHLIVTLEAIGISEEAYSDKPTQGNALALTALIETTQSLIRDLESRQTPERKVDYIDAQVIQPMVTDMIKELSIEINQVRNEMLKYVSIDKQGVVLELIKQALSGFGQKSKLIYDSKIKKLKDLMGAK